jgi:hypothetical protein
LRVDDWSGADDGSTSPRLSRTRWPGSVPLRSGWARALFAAITVAFAVFALPHSRYFAHAAPAGASSGVTPRLQIDDLAFTLPAGRACSLEPVRWRIVGYTGGSYTIEWTVTHEQGRPWSWEPMTEHPGPQGELEVPICPSVVGDARSRFLVTGVLTPVTTPGAVGDGASLATAHISVDVRG